MLPFFIRLHFFSSSKKAGKPRTYPRLTLPLQCERGHTSTVESGWQQVVWLVELSRLLLQSVPTIFREETKTHGQLCARSWHYQAEHKPSSPPHPIYMHKEFKNMPGFVWAHHSHPLVLIPAVYHAVVAAAGLLKDSRGQPTGH